MTELPPIRQDIDIDVSQSVMGLEELIAQLDKLYETFGVTSAEAGNFSRHLGEEGGELSFVGLMLREMRQQLLDAAGATHAADFSAEEFNRTLRELDASVAAAAGFLGQYHDEIDHTVMTVGPLIEQIDQLSGGFLKDGTSAYAAARAIQDYREQLEKTAAVAPAAASIFAASAAGATRAAYGFRLFGIGVRGTTLLMHGLISGFIEWLAVAIPGTIALGAAIFAWSQGAQNAFQHMQALYTATESLGQAAGRTFGNFLGLSGVWQKIQNQANPNVYQAMGSALLILQQHFGNLAQTGLRVGRIFDTFAAKLVQDFSSGGGAQVNRLLSKMVIDLVQFGQILGNIGHAIVNFADKMPGAANVLLSFLDIMSRFIVAVSSLPRGLLYTILLLHEFNTWGSVVIAMLGRMIGVNFAVEGSFFGLGRAIGVIRALMLVLPALMFKIGTAIKGMAASLPLFSTEIGAAGGAIASFGAKIGTFIEGLSGGWILVIAAMAVGLGILIDKLATAQSSAQKFAQSLQDTIDKASNVHVLGELANAIGQLSQKYAQASNESQHLAATTAGVVSRYGGVTQATAQAQQAADTYRASLNSMAQQFQAVTAHAQYLGKAYHTSLYGGLMLADQAGVKLNKTLTAQQWAIAKIKIDSLARGYRAMGVASGAVGADMEALAIQSGLAATKVSQVNQAWDQFMQNLTGGTSGLAAFMQSLTNLSTGTTKISNILGQAGNVTLSIKSFANSLTSFTGKGAQAWQNFNQVVGNTAPQLIDWMRIAGAEGALGSQKFSQGVLDMIAPLAKLAGASKTAQAEVLGLAQQAGLGIRSFPQLEARLKTTGAAAGKLGSIIGPATQAMANMGQVAQNLGNVLGSLVTTAFAQAALKASGFYTAVANLDAAIKKYGADSPQAANAARIVADAQHYANQIAATGVGLYGKALPAAYQASADKVQELKTLIDQLHNKSITLTVTIAQNGGITLPGGGGRRITVPTGVPGATVPAIARSTNTSSVAFPGVVHVHVQGSVHSEQSLANAVQSALLSKAFLGPTSGAFWPGRRT